MEKIKKGDSKCIFLHFSSSQWQVKSRVRKGIPDSLRGQVWPALADIETIKKNSGKTYLVRSFF